MWFFSKVKNFVQINFTFFFTLNYWAQVNKKRVQQILNGQQKLWVYLSLIPLFVFLEKAKVSNPCGERKCESFSKFKPLTVIPERIEGKKIRKRIDWDNRTFSVPFHLNVNKKKEEGPSFFSIQAKYLNTTYKNHSTTRNRKRLSLFRSSWRIREFSCWEVGQSPKRKKKRIAVSKEVWNYRSFTRTRWDSEKRFTFLSSKSKWKKTTSIEYEKVWIETIWKIIEKREVLYRNALYWTIRFGKYWEEKKMKGSFSYKPKFRTVGSKFISSNTFLLFSSNSAKTTQRLIWNRRLPFSKITHVPIVNSRTFRRRIKRNKRRVQYINMTSAERFVQSPSSSNTRIRRWSPIHQRLKYIREPEIFSQEGIRLCDKNTPKSSQLNPYVVSSDFIKDKAENVIREARWVMRSNRRCGIDSTTFISRRPYRKVQLAEWQIGRRFHPWRSRYQRSIRQQTTSSFSIQIRKKWDERKHILFPSTESSKKRFSYQKNRFHDFQLTVRLNFSSSSISGLSNFLSITNDNILWFNKKSWGRWNNLNLPLLAKERREWLKCWNQRNPFLLGEIRRAGSSYRKSQGRQNFSWWRLIGPISLSLPEREVNNLPWIYVNTFFQNPVESHSAFQNTIKTNVRKELRPSVSPPIIQLDQRIFSSNWIIRNEGRILPRDCIFWINQNRWTCRILPFSIFLLIRRRNILKSGFDSVQHDFTHALYRLILRGGRIEIEPEWIEWLLNTLGLSRKNARIRIYLIQERNKRLWIKQVIGMKKEVPIFLTFLLYLRSWKRKFLLWEEKDIMIFNATYLSPTLLVGTPGTGKTSLIRLLADEAKVPVVYQCLSSFTDASSNFTSFGFGRTVVPRAIQRGFREARSRIPVVFFLDEIDILRINRSIFSSLTSNETKNEFIFEILGLSIGGSAKSDQILGLGQLLVEIDRNKKNRGLALFRATNRPKELDPAIVRPGRFHQVLIISLPNKIERRSILKFYLERSPILPRITNQVKRSWEKWLMQTKGKSPAYLMALRSVAVLHKRVRRPIFSLE
jgi:hypothetical protein